MEERIQFSQTYDPKGLLIHLLMFTCFEQRKCRWTSKSVFIINNHKFYSKCVRSISIYLWLWLKIPQQNQFINFPLSQNVSLYFASIFWNNSCLLQPWHPHTFHVFYVLECWCQHTPQLISYTELNFYSFNAAVEWNNKKDSKDFNLLRGKFSRIQQLIISFKCN